MSVQDKLERILRELHIAVSRGRVSAEEPEFVLVNKKEMQRQLSALSQAVSEMMEIYEATEQSRNRGELEAEKQRAEIVRNAGRQAEDIYAASVIYTDDALGRIQDIIDAAEKSARGVLQRLNREMEEEKRIVRSNQLELKTQLEDLKDTAKYMKIIEERNREIAREKAKRQGGDSRGRQGRREEKEPEFVAIHPEIKINEEYFEKAGLTPEGLPAEEPESQQRYEKPEIKINEEYFKRAGISLENGEEKESEPEHTQEETGQEKAAQAERVQPEPSEDEAAGDEAQAEFAGELTPELEEKLMEELDIEYFEWRDREKEESAQKGRRHGLFSFRRGEKS